MTELIITRGFPASGKSTWAKQWLAHGDRRARSNRDELRASVFGKEGVLEYAAEESISAIQRETVRTLLRSGHDVVVDDTHLRLRYARGWADLARDEQATFSVKDFEVPLTELLHRDRARLDAGGRGVGEEALTKLWERFRNPFQPVEPTPIAALAVSHYQPDEALPPAWLVDVDGTLALMGERGPFEWHRVGEDAPNPSVIALVRSLASGDGVSDVTPTIIVMSGRDEVCRPATEVWLAEHLERFDHLFMRPAGDNRKDSIVKQELFDAHVRGRWNVRGVVDDRAQVVAMWRAMGLMCAQVAEGDF